MSTMVQPEVSTIKPRSDAIRRTAETVKHVFTDHPFFNWRWVLVDVLVIAVWIAH